MEVVVVVSMGCVFCAAFFPRLPRPPGGLFSEVAVIFIGDDLLVPWASSESGGVVESKNCLPVFRSLAKFFQSYAHSGWSGSEAITASRLGMLLVGGEKAGIEGVQGSKSGTRVVWLG